METKTRALAEGTIVTGGAGGFAGYASVFEPEVDREGDTVAPGAFREGLPRFIERGFISGPNHDWTSPVATIKDAREDRRGLWLEAEFHSDPQSQIVRTRTAERLARGKAADLSIGFQPLDFERTATGRSLTRIELFEASLCAVGALASAGVVAAKARPPGRVPAPPPGPDLDDPIALLRRGAEVAVLLDKGCYVPAAPRRAADRAAAWAARALDVKEPAVRWYAARGDPAWAPAHAFGTGPPDRLAAPVDAKAFYAPVTSPNAVYVRLATAATPWQAAESVLHETRHLWHRSVLGADKLARATPAQLAALDGDAEAFAADLVAQLGALGALGEDWA